MPPEVTLTEVQARLDALQAENVALKEAGAARDAEVARLREAAILSQARTLAATTLRGIEMPEITRSRLVESLASNPPVKDGALDTAAFTTAITEAAKAEMDYLAKVTGGGAIRGMGSAPAAELKAGEAEASLAESFKLIGFPENVAKVAAAGRG